MTQDRQSPKRVLVVDDDTPLAGLICEVLHTAGGLRAELADDGESALQAWRKGHFDLLIVDNAMPGMNGLELLDALRQLNGAKVPAIMISGNPVEDEALRQGVSAFLSKPFPMKRLLEEVAGVLGVQSAESLGPANE